MARRVAYAVVHRHGHRTPGGNLFNSLAEAEFWRAFLPPEEETRRVSDSHPFGLLTQKGLDHMMGIGAAVVQAFPGLQHPTSVCVRSTNYDRTQMSAKAVLFGMGLTDRTIQVAASSDCAMSAFDSNPMNSKAIFERIQGSESFMASVEGVSNVSQQMSTAIPELGQHRLGFDWFGAFDYYTCRRGHGIDVADELKGYEFAVLQHVVDRYSQYNKDRDFAVSFTLPLLRSIVGSLEGAVSSDRGPGLTVFSCHDTNVIGLLYALQDLGSFLPRDQNGGAACHGAIHPSVISWPGFGTTVVFELIQDDTNASSQTVNIYYNLNPLKFMHKDCLSPSHSVDHIVSNDHAYVLPSALASSAAPRCSGNGYEKAQFKAFGENAYRGQISIQRCHAYMDSLSRSGHDSSC